MSRLELRLFGSPAILVAGTEIDFALKKGIGLLAWLARAGNPKHRDKAAALLWPDSDQKSARTSLRRTLHRLNALADQPIVSSNGDYLVVSPAITCDTNVYQSDLQALQPGNSEYEISIDVLQAAIDRYTDFMGGFSIPELQDFEEWIMFEHQSLEQVQSRSLLELIDRLDQNDESDKALKYANRLSAIDPLNEQFQQVLIRLLLNSGQVAEAHRQYENLTGALLDEIGVAPSATTRALFDQTEDQLDPITPETRYVKSGEVYIAYQVLGNGPVDLIQIPGFVSHLEVAWEEPGVVDFYSKLAEHYRVILFDRRGVGLSDRIGYHPTPEDTALDVLAILDEVGSHNAVVMGVSEGGPGGVYFATHNPDRCRGLILYGTMARGTCDTDYPWMPEPAVLDNWLERWISRWGEPAYITMFAPGKAEDIGFRRWWTRVLTRAATPGTMRGVVNALKNADVRNLLADIEVPSLVVHRVDDQAINVGNARYLAEQIPAAQYAELPGNDHWWWVGDNQPILDAISGFISGIQQNES